MIVPNEDYAKAKTLATITHFGETFRVVRRRINGKPWRKYLVLVQGDTFVAGLCEIVDPADGARVSLARLNEHFPTRDKLMSSLAPILAAYKPGAKVPIR